MRATTYPAISSVRPFLRATILVVLLFPGALLSVRAAEPTTAQTPVPLSHPGTLVGRTSAAQTITVAAALKPANQKTLDAFLADLYNPASPTFHRYLTPRQYTQRFFDAAARKQVAAYLQSLGFTVNDPGLGALIDATGTVAQVERAFTVRLSDYRDAKGRVFYTNDVTPALPVAIVSVIYGIIGLDNAPVAVPLSQARRPAPAPGPSRDAPRRQSVCTGAQGIYDADPQTYLPSQLATAYHLNDLYSLGYHGEGQTIAFLQLADYHDADPQTYQACFGTNVPLTRVLVDGGPTGASQYDGEVEVDIDIETVVSLVPHLAGILNYMATDAPLSITHIDQKIANDNLASIVSISWGLCEPRYSGHFALIIQHTAFEQMAAQGQTVFSGTGDSGSTSCLPANQGGTHQLATFYPSTDPYVTAVGGTHVTIDDTTGAWTGETVWNTAPNTYGAGGGGVSIFWNRPSYQSGPGTDNATLNPSNLRMVPDVTIAGDAQYIAYAAGTWQVFGGTSIGGPFWAAGTALVNQYLIDHGKTRLGFANPALYAVFDAASYFSTFHDVTAGNNCFDPLSTCGTGNLYTATANYDMASGIGSPMFTTLAGALGMLPLSPTITGITPNRGLAAGGNTVTITGTNFVAGTGVSFGFAFTYVPATNVVVVNATTITATVPASATAGAADVALTKPAPAPAQITLPGAYTYMPNALPGPQPPGNPAGSPGALPNPRQPTGPPLNNPSPLPPRRP